MQQDVATIIKSVIIDAEPRECLLMVLELLRSSTDPFSDTTHSSSERATNTNTALVILLDGLPRNAVWQVHSPRCSIILQTYTAQVKLVSQMVASANDVSISRLVGKLYHNALDTFIAIAYEVLQDRKYAGVMPSLALQVYTAMGVVE